MSNTSPYRTSSDLVLEALSNLGVLAAGQPVDVEDFNWVNEKLDSIYRKLAGLEICYVPDPNNIPGAWFSDLADIVAGECASKFGLVGQELMDKIKAAGLSLARSAKPPFPSASPVSKLRGLSPIP